ncbi:hypothetical protein PENTCL1PPCAC_8066, partial [Pristionchus entomophagus]
SFPMSSSGRGASEEEEDATLENVKRASRQLDNIVDGIIKKGHKMSNAIRDRPNCPVESGRSREKENDRDRRKKYDEDGRVVRLRFASTASNEDGEIQYVVSKRKAVFHSNMHEVRLRSNPHKGSETQLRLKVSRSADPDWTHMTIMVMDPNERLMATVDLECRGEETRLVRINGLEATPSSGVYGDIVREG